MRNIGILGTDELVRGLTLSLESIDAPLDVRVPASNDDPFDATVTVRLPHASLTLAVEVKLSSPRSRAELALLPEAPTGMVPVLVAPFLSPAVRDELRRSGWSYWDATGNMLISSADPVVWIDRQGAIRNPAPEVEPGSQKLRSLKAKVTSEVIVRLLRDRRAASVRELSRETNTGLGTVSRIVDLLRDEDLLEDTRGGQIIIRDQLELAKRWTEDYSFATTFKPGRYFSLLGDDVALKRLSDSSLMYALTGARAAALEFESRGVVSPLPATETWVYTDDVSAMGRTLDLAADRRGSILVAKCEFLPQFREGTQSGQPRIARPWRIVGDLLSAGGRLSAVGENLAALQPREITV